MAASSTSAPQGGFASDVCLTGRTWDAEEGLRRGAVDRIAPPGESCTVMATGWLAVAVQAAELGPDALAKNVTNDVLRIVRIA